MSDELPPFDEVNAAFHRAYDRARAQAERRVPVIVVLADKLVLHQRQARVEVELTPPLFSVIKSIAHVPIALFSFCSLGAARATGAENSAALARLKQSVLASRARLDDDSVGGDVDAAVLANLRAIIARSLAFLDETAAAGAAPDALARFAHELGPALLRTTHDGTRVQLAALHRQTGALVSRLSAEERRSFQVVVTGDHQARVRSLPMQYFRKLLREPAGKEERVVYAEGVDREDDALSLVGTRLVDRAIATAFFGDRDRLQRDVLGDEAQALLEGFELSPLAADVNAEP